MNPKTSLLVKIIILIALAVLGTACAAHLHVTREELTANRYWIGAFIGFITILRLNLYLQKKIDFVVLPALIAVVGTYLAYVPTTVSETRWIESAAHYLPIDHIKYVTLQKMAIVIDVAVLLGITLLVIEFLTSLLYRKKSVVSMFKSVSMLAFIAVIQLVAIYMVCEHGDKKANAAPNHEKVGETVKVISREADEVPHAVALKPTSDATIVAGRKHSSKNTDIKSKKKGKQPVRSLQTASTANMSGHALSAELPTVGPDFDVRTPCDVPAEILDRSLLGALKNKGEVFVDAGKKEGINHVFLASLSMHEGDRGKSRLAITQNNPTGEFEDDGKTPRTFASIDEAIYFNAHHIASSHNYVKGGNCTVAKIQKVYCPVGAKNDRKKLNKDWLPGVVSYMKELYTANEKISSM